MISNPKVVALNNITEKQAKEIARRLETTISSSPSPSQHLLTLSGTYSQRSAMKRRALDMATGIHIAAYAA